MNKYTYWAVEQFKDDYTTYHHFNVLDVGSRLAKEDDMCHRSLFPNQTYTGVDIQVGPNVDVVLLNPYDYSDFYGQYEVVISGQCLEHVARPWVWIKELGKCLKPNGLLCIVAPNTWAEHRHPEDYWRVFPDGLKILFEEAGLETLSCYRYGPNTVGTRTPYPTSDRPHTVGVAKKYAE